MSVVAFQCIFYQFMPTVGRYRVCIDDHERNRQRDRETDLQVMSQVVNLRRLEKMQFPTKDEDFKRRLLKGGLEYHEYYATSSYTQT